MHLLKIAFLVLRFMEIDMVSNAGILYSVPLSQKAKRDIAFSVRTCLRKGIDLQKTLSRVYRDWGCNNQVKSAVINLYKGGL
jgi:hypothetical protein